MDIKIYVPVFFSFFLLLFFFSQGEIIDNIEQNVSQSVDHIIQAKEETKKAVRYQTKARKVKCFAIYITNMTFSCCCFLFYFSHSSTFA